MTGIWWQRAMSKKIKEDRCVYEKDCLIWNYLSGWDRKLYIYACSLPSFLLASQRGERKGCKRNIYILKNQTILHISSQMLNMSWRFLLQNKEWGCIILGWNGYVNINSCCYKLFKDQVLITQKILIQTEFFKTVFLKFAWS